jgi:hypothetical protein
MGIGACAQVAAAAGDLVGSVELGITASSSWRCGFAARERTAILLARDKAASTALGGLKQ